MDQLQWALLSADGLGKDFQIVDLVAVQVFPQQTEGFREGLESQHPDIGAAVGCKNGVVANSTANIDHRPVVLHCKTETLVKPVEQRLLQTPDIHFAAYPEFQSCLAQLNLGVCGHFRSQEYASNLQRSAHAGKQCDNG